MHVEHGGGDPPGGERVGGGERLGHENGAAGDQGHVGSLAQRHGAAELEILGPVVDRCDRFAVEAQVGAAAVRGGAFHQPGE